MIHDTQNQMVDQLPGSINAPSVGLRHITGRLLLRLCTSDFAGASVAFHSHTGVPRNQPVRMVFQWEKPWKIMENHGKTRDIFVDTTIHHHEP